MKTWMKRIGVLMLAAVLAFPSVNFPVHAEETAAVQEAATQSESATTATGTTETEAGTAVAALAAPTNLRWDGWVAKWDTVENAVDYEVEFYYVRESGDKHIFSAYVTEGEYDPTQKVFEDGGVMLDNGAGEYYFVVTARGKTASGDSQYGDSVAVTGPKQQYGTILAAPTNLRWDGWYAAWDAVENASHYDLYVYGSDGTEQCLGLGSDVTSYLITYKITLTPNVKYWFKVAATAQIDGIWTKSESSSASAEQLFEYAIKTIPTDVKWTENYGMSFMGNADYGCRVELLRDGNRVGMLSSTGMKSGEVYETAYRQAFDESGTYCFRVRYFDKDNRESAYSEWVYSSDIEYVKPEAAMEAVVPTWSKTQGGTLEITAPEGACGFEMYLYKYDDADSEWKQVSRYADNGGKIYARGFSSTIRGNAGKYKACARLLSGDLDTIANGNLGGYSEIYEYDGVADKLPAPTGITWNGWVASWKEVPACNGYYSLYIYKNGENLTKVAISPEAGLSCDIVSVLKDQGFAMEVGASYTVALTANATSNTLEYETSAVSEQSEAKVWEEADADVTNGLVNGVLQAPGSLSWGKNYTAEFCLVPAAWGRYKIQLWKDNEVYRTISVRFNVEEGDNNNIGFGFADSINESGTYKFRVQATNGYYDAEDNVASSEWSAFSEEKVYVRPDKTLESVKAVWGEDDNAGTLYFDSVEGAGGYEIRLKVTFADGRTRVIYYWVDMLYGSADKAGIKRSENFLEQMKAEGVYTANIRALSADIETIANGEWADSPAYSTYATTEEVAGAITDTVSGCDSVAEALDKLTGTGSAADSEAAVSAAELQIAMQTSEDVLKQVEDLEEAYAQELLGDQNASVEDIVSTTAKDAEVANYVNVNEISMVGAATNAEKKADGTVSKISLDVAKSDNAKVMNTYKRAVGLDIKLTRDGESVAALKTPVTITMPLPAGFTKDDVKKLQIIHISDDASIAKEYLTLENQRLKYNAATNEITFTVTHFSDFIITDGELAGGTGTGGNDNDDDSDDNDKDGADSSSSSGLTAPKTGDNFSIALPIVLCACMAAVACLLRKRAQLR